MARRRSNEAEEGADEVRYKSVVLRATVMEPSAGPFEMTTEDALELFRLSDARALRQWHAQGLPFRRVGRREVRYGTDAVIWRNVREWLKAKGRWRGNTHLTMDRAYRIEMYLQSTDDVAPERMVLVPLNHDHPLRERMLQMACAGKAPRPVRRHADDLTDDDLEVWEPEAALDTR